MAETKNVKVTKAQRFAMIREIVEASGSANTADLIAFIDHEVELLNKKHSSGKLTATQKENVTIKEQIVKALTDLAKPVTITELTKVEGLDYTSQKISALVKQLVDDGKVVKTQVKKVSYFTIADTAEVDTEE
jgi:predicted HTH transcriptional regulator